MCFYAFEPFGNLYGLKIVSQSTFIYTAVYLRNRLRDSVIA